MTVFANETDAYAQAAHADTVYKSGAYLSPATSNYVSTSPYAVQFGGSVYADQQARVASAYAGYSTVTNDNLATGLNSTTGLLGVPSYTGGNTVTVAANRAGVDLYPEDAQKTEDLEQEVRVHDALVATSPYGRDALFSRGGPIGTFSASNYSSPYIDSMWLAEASKQTGTKLF